MPDAFFLPPPLQSKRGGGLILKINPYNGVEDSIDTVAWYKSGQEYYLFLPADCDRSALTVYLDGADKIRVGLTEVSDGETTAAFSHGCIFAVRAGGKPYTVKLMQSENLPTVYIETESGSLDYLHASKENKEKANIRIYEDGEMTLDGELKQIKGRGNSSWSGDKRPYNVKFDKKTSVLGMDKAKKWALIASTNDVALLKNPLGWYLAEKEGLPYGSDYRIVDVYINRVYYGNYIICENVEIGDGRVEITDLTKATEKVNDKELEDYERGGTGENGAVPDVTEYPCRKWTNIPNDPDDITGGYLLECDQKNRWGSEASGFVTERAQAVVVKEPEFASKAQVEYISSYWQEAEDAVCSPDGYNSLGKHYSEYFDMDSTVNMYILQEFSNNIDGGVTSCYFCKDTDGKLVAAPVWDCDHCFGGSFHQLGYNYAAPFVWTANQMDYNGVESLKLDSPCPTIFNRLYRHEDFRALVSARWSELSETFGGQDTLDFLNGIAEMTRAAAIMNGVRWNGFYTEIQHKNEVLKTLSFVVNRRHALDKGFAKDAVMLYYDVNGGKGLTLETRIMTKGEVTNIKGLTYDGNDLVPPSAGLCFAGWNTKPDGTGKTYLPGTLITLNKTMTLYAQWKTVPTYRQSLSWVFENPLMSIFKSIRSTIISFCTFC